MIGDIGHCQPLLDRLYETVSVLENRLWVTQVDITTLRQLIKRDNLIDQ
jgi:hypothetical protein